MWLRERPRCVAVLLVLAGALGWPSEGAGQTVHPNLAVFRPSLDHDATGADGQPLLDHYELSVSHFRTGRLALVLNLGKPSPDPDGFIRVNVEDAVNVPALFEATLEARVTAVGNGGVSSSGPSNLFSADGCRIVAPGSLILPAGGGAVDAPVVLAGCRLPGAGRLEAAALEATPARGAVHVEAARNSGDAPLVRTRGLGTQLLFVLQPAAR